VVTVGFIFVSFSHFFLEETISSRREVLQQKLFEYIERKRVIDTTHLENTTQEFDHHLSFDGLISPPPSSQQQLSYSWTSSSENSPIHFRNLSRFPSASSSTSMTTSAPHFTPSTPITPLVPLNSPTSASSTSTTASTASTASTPQYCSFRTNGPLSPPPGLKLFNPEIPPRSHFPQQMSDSVDSEVSHSSNSSSIRSSTTQSLDASPSRFEDLASHKTEQPFFEITQFKKEDNSSNFFSPQRSFSPKSPPIPIPFSVPTSSHSSTHSLSSTPQMATPNHSQLSLLRFHVSLPPHHPNRFFESKTPIDLSRHFLNLFQIRNRAEGAFWRPFYSELLKKEMTAISELPQQTNGDSGTGNGSGGTETVDAEKAKIKKLEKKLNESYRNISQLTLKYGTKKEKREKKIESLKNELKQRMEDLDYLLDVIETMKRSYTPQISTSVTPLVPSTANLP
jgi:hypothetical protein